MTTRCIYPGCKSHNIFFVVLFYKHRRASFDLPFCEEHSDIFIDNAAKRSKQFKTGLLKTPPNDVEN